MIKAFKPSSSKKVCDDKNSGSYPKKPMVPFEKKSVGGTVKYNGFQKPKALKEDNRKPIDKLLDIEAKKV